jgi:hypothetical protein
MRTQEELRQAADAVLRDLGLDERLRELGDPVLVGSTALGVMVAQDIDLTVIVQRLDQSAASAVAHLGAELALHPEVHQVRLRDDTGRWNTDPAYPDGLYLGIGYADWSLDLWFVDEPERQPDLSHLETLLPRLTAANRELIITLKTSLATTPSPGPKVPSFEVYRAVLDHDVTTRAEFDEWIAGE